MSDEEPIVFNTSINESGIPGVVPENPCELENKNFSHTQYIERDPRNPQNPSKKERMMCHAETRSKKIIVEEHGIMRDLRPMAGSAEEVIEPVSIIRGSTSVVQTAEISVSSKRTQDIKITE